MQKFILKLRTHYYFFAGGVFLSFMVLTLVFFTKSFEFDDLKNSETYSQIKNQVSNQVSYQNNNQPGYQSNNQLDYQKKYHQLVNSDFSELNQLKLLPDNSIAPVKIITKANSIPLLVEVVTSPEALALGLGKRSEIGSDGMLFVFSEPKNIYFWMLNMEFDLDIIWIKNGKILRIDQNVSAPSSPSNTKFGFNKLLTSNSPNLPKYQSPDKVDSVLEVPAGFTRDNNIFSGDFISVK
jgi:uncharacterized membrane protein (UPF0127 family)